MTDSYDVTSLEFSQFAMDEMNWEDRTEARFTWDGDELTGTVLGFASSRPKDPTAHNNHRAGTPPKEGFRCSSCRWAEIALMRVRGADSDTYTYALLTMGKTILPGEDTRVGTFWSEAAMSVLEALYKGGTNGVPRRIPLPNAAAFRLAAEVDAGIRAVLDEWTDAIPEVDEDYQVLRP